MISYILPVIAVLVGFLLVYFLRPSSSVGMKLLLAFSGAFLLSITIFNLLPEIFEVQHNSSHEEHHHAKSIGLFVMGGILLQIFLEFFSKGAEHGHVHYNHKNEVFPTVLLVSLFIHAVLEGFPIHNTHGLLAGIVVHKIPVAMIISLFLLESSLSKFSIAAFLVLFSFATPIGTFMSANFEMLNQFYSEITAVVVGIFLHISTTILFETTEGHKLNIAKLGTIILAVVLAYFI